MSSLALVLHRDRSGLVDFFVRHSLRRSRDPRQRVRHLRKGPETTKDVVWTTPPSQEIHGDQETGRRVSLLFGDPRRPRDSNPRLCSAQGFRDHPDLRVDKRTSLPDRGVGVSSSNTRPKGSLGLGLGTLRPKTEHSGRINLGPDLPWEIVGVLLFWRHVE